MVRKWRLILFIVLFPPLLAVAAGLVHQLAPAPHGYYPISIDLAIAALAIVVPIYRLRKSNWQR